MRASLSLPSSPAVRLREEDAALFVLSIIWPIVLPYRSAVPTPPTADLLLGVFGVIALSGLAACLAARRRDTPLTSVFLPPGTRITVLPGGSRQVPLRSSLRVLFLIVSLLLGILLEIAICSGYLGLYSVEDAQILPLAIPIAVPLIVAIVARLRLSPTVTNLRRALVAPFVFLATGLFNQLATPLAAGGSSDVGTAVAAVLSSIPISAIVLAPIYYGLVFAPRQVADPEGTAATWGIRFLVSVVGISLGVGLSAVAHG